MTSQPPIDRLPTQAVIPENNDELRKEITHLAGHINAAEHRFLILLGALVQRDAWDAGSGFKTPAHWLNYYCGIDLGAAREKVRVAKSLPTLPLISEAFRNGTVSYSKVRAMTRVADGANEKHLLGIARQSTADHVEKMVRKFQRVQRQIAVCQDEERHESRELTWHHDEDGMMVIKARLEPEEGALFMKAMEAMLQSMFSKSNKPAATVEQSTETASPDANDVSAETPLKEASNTQQSGRVAPKITLRGSHRSGRAEFPHPAHQIKVMTGNGRHFVPPGSGEVGNALETH